MSKPELAFVALGSNLGDSAGIILKAFEQLQKLSDRLLLKSSLWQSAPVDCPPGSPFFINAVAAFEPRLNETPASLLRQLRQIEKSAGRPPKEILNEPRVLDLDLIAFGPQTLQLPELILPHPRAHVRAFVLQPLSEIDPGLILPGQTKTAQQLLEELGPDKSLCRL